MSSPFTSIGDCFAVAFLNEIESALSEREVVGGIGDIRLRPVTPGFDIQQTIRWAGNITYSWQDRVAACVPYFLPVPPGWPGSDDYTGTVVAPYGAGGWSQFCIDAGLCPAGTATPGFRRARSWDPAVNDWTNIADPMFEYGYCQPGDIIGPWMFVDMQNALSRMRFVLRTAGHYTQYWREASGGVLTCDDARTSAIANWNAESWIEGYASGNSPHRLYVYRVELLPTYHAWTCRRCAFSYTRESDESVLFPHPTGRSFAVDLYAKGPAALPLSPEYPTTGLNQALLIKSGMAAGETVVFAKTDIDPITAIGATCPIHSNPEVTDIRFGESFYVVRPDFTHSNG